MEVAYFTLSDKQLYVILDRLFGGGAKAILPPPPTKLLGGGGCPVTLVLTPMCSAA